MICTETSRAVPNDKCYKTVYTWPTLQHVDLRRGSKLKKPQLFNILHSTVNIRKKNPCQERRHRMELSTWSLYTTLLASEWLRPGRPCVQSIYAKIRVTHETEYMVAIHNSAGIRMCTPNSICWSYWYVDTKYNPFLLVWNVQNWSERIWIPKYIFVWARNVFICITTL